ncbi:ROK family protein [Enterococcus caccae]|uniref:Fructokinase n=1 Tax=Enterococcus caccae ATCC BAA-1240 TaxID=1158612 RepID=R3U8V0_9ENTE|nr:ROK family protein [Enterococcus caccae]EOL50399.1 fructokinase [Enterococcus caccae ATCC BAA-1240]EOT59164.1 fructokinase [Enterococcus caccae ATCC BAA-1240]
MAYYGSIEAGGTKFVCAVADEELKIIERISLPTTLPEATLAQVFTFFDAYELKALGVGSFGPIDVNRKSSTYGYITSTPKPGWKNVNLLGALKERYDIPIAWTTDVNAAAYGEMHLGAGKDTQSCIYLTVGTGVGGGAVVNGTVLQGFSHPEMGHISVQRHPEDTLESTCPYHDHCLEGLAAGPALEKRTGLKGQLLEPDHDVWAVEAFYLAQALMNYTLVLSPGKIILGGGVMKQTHLLPKIRESLEQQLGNYVALPALEEYIVGCDLGDNSGTFGCLLLAQEQYA